MNGQSGGKNIWGWLAAIAAIAVVAVLWMAREGGKAAYEADELALRLAQIDGHQTCKLAWLKAMETGVARGRTPSIYAPEVRVPGPPRVVRCGMLRSGGVEAEPLTVIVRCDDVDLRCVDLSG